MQFTFTKRVKKREKKKETIKWKKQTKAKLFYRFVYTHKATKHITQMVVQT